MAFTSTYLAKTSSLSPKKYDKISPHFPKRTALRVGYEQCLDDYAIVTVIKAVTACATQPISELESSLIAALLIEQLPHLINPELIGSYLSAIRREQEVRKALPKLDFYVVASKPRLTRLCLDR